jgi:hypothetical protein
MAICPMPMPLRRIKFTPDGFRNFWLRLRDSREKSLFLLHAQPLDSGTQLTRIRNISRIQNPVRRFMYHERGGTYYRDVLRIRFPD